MMRSGRGPWMVEDAKDAPAPSPDGLLACLRALSEEAGMLGLTATREAAEKLADHPGTALVLGSDGRSGLN
jgi:superfamily II helicase